MSYPTILFWPEENKAVPLSRVRAICERYGIRFHSDPLRSYDLHFFWSYTPCRIIPDSFTLNAPGVINRGCWDVSKERVNDVFNDIRIDPLTYEGKCVAKFDKQGAHKYHKLVTCPTSPYPGYVYQRYIEDREGEYWVKYRMFYADGISFITRRLQYDIFGVKYVPGSDEIIETSRFFSPQAEMEFVRKCQLFGFDYGEIDFVSDNGTPIVVDVNNVAGLPDHGLPLAIEREADESFLNFIERRYDKSS